MFSKVINFFTSSALSVFEESYKSAKDSLMSGINQLVQENTDAKSASELLESVKDSMPYIIHNVTESVSNVAYTVASNSANLAKEAIIGTIETVIDATPISIANKIAKINGVDPIEKYVRPAVDQAFSVAYEASTIGCRVVADFTAHQVNKVVKSIEETPEQELSGLSNFALKSGHVIQQWNISRYAPKQTLSSQMSQNFVEKFITFNDEDNFALINNTLGHNESNDFTSLAGLESAMQECY